MINTQKHLFSLPDSVTYLNGGYMSPQLKSVETIGIECLKKKSLPHTITSEDFFSQRIILKKRFAKLIDAPDYQNIAIIPSASYGIANVANNVKLNTGDEILLVDEQFPSNVYEWKKIAKKQQAIIKIIKPPVGFKTRGKGWNEAILNAINPKTAVVAMPHVHWADGTLFDLKSIREKTRQVQSLLVIDGTQSVGALPFSVKEIQPDALVCAGYKWLMGPYSLGVAYYNDSFNDGEPIENNWVSRLHSEDFTQLTQYNDAYQPKADKYSMGESSNFIMVPMLIKSIEQLLEWQPKNIQEYCKTISTDAIQELRNKNYFVEEDTYRGQHLFGIYIPNNINMETIKERLIQENIFVSYRGKAIRVSPNVYNTKADFDNLLSCF